MKVAMIGGGGFIGHHLALEMRRSGIEPVVLDHFMVNNIYALEPVQGREIDMVNDRLRLLDGERVSIIHVNALDYTILSPLIKRIVPDVIIHLAAVAHIDRSNRDPLMASKNCVDTLLNTLDVVRNLQKRPHFIFFSSSTVYGNWGDREVLAETDELHPYGIYGTAKANSEAWVKCYAEQYDLRTTIVRPCALYGPRCVSGRVLQKFVEAALDKRPITIHGDGSIREDFTYVDDFVDGVMRVISRDNVYGETFNITGGCARSLKEAADIVATEAPTEILYGEPDPEKPARGTMSIEKARDLLGYEPKHTLETGLKAYMDWYRSFEHGRQGS